MDKLNALPVFKSPMFPTGVIVASQQICLPDEVVQLSESFPDIPSLERVHLEHFKRSLSVQMPNLAFACEEPVQKDPPDFLIKRPSDSKQIGLELTTFGTPTEDRQRRAWRFSRVHEHLLRAHANGRLRGLVGLKFDVSFGQLDGVQPQDLDDRILDNLVEALELVANLPRPGFSIDSPSEQWSSGVVGPGVISWSLSGCADGPWRGSMLANQTGFEVEMTVREWTTAATVVAEMNRTIQGKDDPRNEELLIVAGGPTKSGRCFYAGTVLGLVAAQAWSGPAVKPRHLRRVFLDVWGVEKIFLLYEA